MMIVKVMTFSGVKTCVSHKHALRGSHSQSICNLTSHRPVQSLIQCALSSIAMKMRHQKLHLNRDSDPLSLLAGNDQPRLQCGQLQRVERKSARDIMICS